MPNEPPRAHEILGLDLDGAYLTGFGRPFDVGDKLLLLTLELDAFAIELALGLFESALVLKRSEVKICKRRRETHLSQALGGRLSAAKGPLNDAAHVVFWEDCVVSTARRCRHHLLVIDASLHNRARPHALERV